MIIPEIVKGDLLDQEVAVIVNAWNRNWIPWWLLLPQGVSGAIKRHAGLAPFREVARAGAIPLGGAVLTGAGRLPYRGIIHVAGINLWWRATEDSVRKSVRSAMEIVNREGFPSVAFPIIGSGSGNRPKRWALNLMLDEFKKIDSPARVVIVEFVKYKIKLASGRCGLRYLEDGREMRIDSEFLATRKPGIAIRKDSIDRWEAPHENEPVDKERIFNNVLRHFKGYLIDTGDDIDPAKLTNIAKTCCIRFNNPESLLIYGEDEHKISIPFLRIESSGVNVVVDSAALRIWDDGTTLTAERKERLMNSLGSAFSVWFIEADELWNSRQDDVPAAFRAILRLSNELPEYGLFRESRLFRRITTRGLACRAMLAAILQEADALLRRPELPSKPKEEAENVSKAITTLFENTKD